MELCCDKQQHCPGLCPSVGGRNEAGALQPSMTQGQSLSVPKSATAQHLSFSSSHHGPAQAPAQRSHSPGQKPLASITAMKCNIYPHHPYFCCAINNINISITAHCPESPGMQWKGRGYGSTGRQCPEAAPWDIHSSRDGKLH